MILNAVFNKVEDAHASDTEDLSAAAAQGSPRVQKRRQPLRPPIHNDPDDDSRADPYRQTSDFRQAPRPRPTNNPLASETLDFFIGEAGHSLKLEKVQRFADTLFRLSQYQERLKFRSDQPRSTDARQKAAEVTPDTQADSDAAKKAESEKPSRPPIEIPRRSFIPGPVRTDKLSTNQGSDSKTNQDFRSRWAELRKGRKW